MLDWGFRVVEGADVMANAGPALLAAFCPRRTRLGMARQEGFVLLDAVQKQLLNHRGLLGLEFRLHIMIALKSRSQLGIGHKP